MLNEKEAHQFVYTFVKEVWCDQNPKKIPEHYSQDFVGCFNGAELFYYDDLYKRIEFSQKNFKKNELDIEMAFSISENRLASQFSMQRENFDSVKSRVNVFSVIEIFEKKVRKIWLFSEDATSYLPK